MPDGYLLSKLAEMAAAENRSTAVTAETEAMASFLPHSHGTPAGTLAKIFASGKFISKQRLEDRTEWEQYIEFERETLDDVFFYLAPIRFPTGAPAGILLKREIDAERTDACTCPFDTGALEQYFTLPGTESLTSKIATYEVPVEKAGGVLRMWSTVCYDDARSYLDGKEIDCSSPIGVTLMDGCDCRAWTFETRFPGEVDLNPAFIEAIFLGKRRITSDEISDLASWAREQNILYSYRATGNDEQDFKTLKLLSRDYIDRLLEKAAA